MKKVHPEFPDYWVHSDGTISRRVDSQKYHRAGDTLAGRITVSGYRQHKLTDCKGRRREVRTNRLVCEAFFGRPPSAAHHAAHKDGDRLNNRSENLYWATPEQNKADSISHGTSVRGTRTRNQNGEAKLTEATVAEIRASYTGKRGELVKLAAKYGVGPTCIQKVVSNQTWRQESAR